MTTNKSIHNWFNIFDMKDKISFIKKQANFTNC